MAVFRGIKNALLPSLVLWALIIWGANAAFGQSVQQSGSITPNTSPIWNSNGVIKGGNTATDSPLTTFGVTRDAADAICVSSARSTAAGRNQLCLQAATSGPAKISLQNYGTATAQNLQFILNGVTLTLPSGGGTFITGVSPYVVGRAACFNSTTGIIQDCGVSVTSGTQFGIPYYSTTSTLVSSGAATSGQIFLGQNAAAPLWTNLSGDVASLSAGGALTLSKVNGIPFSSTYTAHGVLVGEGSSAFTSVATSNVGQCLLSQGSSADPIWSSCAAGTGSAGGSDTQVQFNNATSLGGSVNLKWVSPALTIGVAGTTTGQLALASSTATGTVTLQAPGVASAYNFNYPIGAGTTGQPLISGGGGSTPNTFGTLGIIGGGTNCSAASGTCLDNIAGFASTGFIQRTGAGTYAFSNVITVSGGGTGLANGTSGGIPAFTGATTMTSSGVLAQYSLVAGGGAGAVPATVTKGTAGQILIDQTAANPIWSTMSGDATINSAGALTIANSAVTVGKMANAAAYTLMGNFTGSTAAPQLSTMGSLTQKASPAAGDYVVIQDNSASGQLKYATVSSVSSAGSVSSFNTLTGAVTFVTSPEGRLTLVTGVPVMVSDQTAKSIVYYSCYRGGGRVPYYTGAADAVENVPACEVSMTMVSAASAGQVVSGQVYDIWWVHGGANRICVAMSASSGGAGGWASDTAGSATARGTGYSQLDYTTRPYITNANSITNCFNAATNYGPVSANQGTYLGTFYATANGQTGMGFTPAAGAGGSDNILGLYNAYNRVPVKARSIDSNTGTTALSSNTWAKMAASASNRIRYVDGLAQSSVRGEANNCAYATSNGGALIYSVGVSRDWSSGAPTNPNGAFYSAITGRQDTVCPIGRDMFLPAIGFHSIDALEAGSTATSQTKNGLVTNLTNNSLTIELDM